MLSPKKLIIMCLIHGVCVDSLRTSLRKKCFLYKRCYFKGLWGDDDLLKSVSIDFSSVLNGLKSKLNELNSMSIYSNLSSSQLYKIFIKIVLKKKFCIKYILKVF
jgi:hypothetical protein